MNPPPNPDDAQARAAMREYNAPLLVNPSAAHVETILMTWTRSDGRTWSDDEIAAWYTTAAEANRKAYAAKLSIDFQV